MIERGGGAFLVTASAAGLLAHPTAVPYVVTKHAAVALAESFAIEFGDKGIYVSCLCPQGVRTRLIECEGDNPNSFLLPESISAEDCADAVIKGLDEENFLILPHREVADYIVKKAEIVIAGCIRSEKSEVPFWKKEKNLKEKKLCRNYLKN